MNHRITPFLAECKLAQSEALFVFNIADFKRYNDVLWYQQGDKAIAKLETSIREIISPQGTLLRLSGDVWIARVDGDAHSSALEIIKDFSETISRPFGWTCSAFRGIETATSTETTLTEIHLRVRCVYAYTAGQTDLRELMNSMLNACHGFEPTGPLPLDKLILAPTPPWRAIVKLPSAVPYCPFCMASKFEWTDGDTSIYGGDGNCLACNATVRFSNINVDA